MLEIALFLIVFVTLPIVLLGTVQGIRAMGAVRKCLDEMVPYKAALRRVQDRLDAVERGLANLVAPRPDASAQETQPAPAEQAPEPAAAAEAQPPPAAAPEPEAMAALVEKLRATRDAAARPQTTADSGVEPVAPEAPRETWADLEEIIGKRWMTWVGVVVLFLSAAFFFKYAHDQGWLGRIGPGARVTLGIAFGIGLLAAGGRFVRRDMRALGLGLFGGGLGILYLSIFAAFAMYKLVPQPAAFAMMVVVSGVGMAFAVFHDAISVSFLAVLGGVLTPLMLRTGHDARDALFTYLTLLNLTVLGVALFKQWRPLEVLAFAGTWALFAGWFGKFYSSAGMVPTSFWLAVFYLTFLVLPFAYHLRHRSATTVQQFVMALAHATISFGYFHRVLYTHHHHVLGCVALGMSACYAALGVVSRKRAPGDARGVFGFIGLAVVFLTLAIPLHLKLYGITIAWALEGPALLYLGYKYSYRPVRFAGFFALLLAAFRAFVVHWPLHAGAFVPVFNRAFFSVMCVPVAGWAYAVIHRVHDADATAKDRVLRAASAIIAGFMALVIFQCEAGEWLRLRGRHDLARCAVTVLWALGSVGFLCAGLRLRSLAYRVSGLAALVFAVVGTATFHAQYARGDYFLLLSPRFMSMVLVGLTFFTLAFLLRRGSDACTGEELEFGKYLFVAAGLLLLIGLSVEFHCYCIDTIGDVVRAKWMARMLVALVWVFGSIAFMAVGLSVGSLLARGTGCVALIAAAAFGWHLHAVDERGVAALFLSPRFLTELIVVATIFGYAWILRRHAGICAEGERALGKKLWAVAIAFLLLVMTLEVDSYWMQRLVGSASAKWVARMSVTMLWGVYATALLAVGFWQRVRPLRLAALALFGVTALKLIVVDMGGVQQIYRILGFVVVGVLMIAASYLYHRLETMLQPDA